MLKGRACESSLQEFIHPNKQKFFWIVRDKMQWTVSDLFFIIIVLSKKEHLNVSFNKPEENNA